MAERVISTSPECTVVGTEGMFFETIHDSITGGVILDLTGFTGTEVKEGHLILKDASGNYKPMPISDDSYDTAPTGFSPIGICPVTTALNEAKCPVVLAGKANEALAPYALTDAQKTALSHIIWQ